MAGLDALNPDVIFDPNRVVGCEGEIHDVVESTMDTARRLAVRRTAEAPDGYVVLAQEQRSGRGRTGTWECRRGDGLLMSVILRLGVRTSERKLIALMGAVSAAEAIQHFGPDARIKWPNDVVVAEAPCGALKLRKLGGVLVEQVRKGDATPVHLLGIGLNANQDRRRLPAVRQAMPPTSVKIELGGRPVDRSELCHVLLGRLDHWYGKLRLGQSEALLARWRTLSCLLGETVRAEVRGRMLDGEVIGIRATGELILRLPGGREIFLNDHETKLLF